MATGLKLGGDLEEIVPLIWLTHVMAEILPWQRPSYKT